GLPCRADDVLGVRADRRVRSLHLSRRPLSPGRRPDAAAQPQRAHASGGRQSPQRRQARRMKTQGEQAHMNPRKFFVTAIVTAITVLVAACGSTSTASNPAQQSGTLTVWLMNGSAPQSVVDGVNAD